MASLSKQKILITGIEGFTGTHLKKYFIKCGMDVYGTTFVSSYISDKVYLCDITQKENIKKLIASICPDYIVHLAGISLVSCNDDNIMFNVNFLGTKNLLSAAMESNITINKIIIPSSAVVYGNIPDTSCLDESLCPNPVNNYGIIKLAMEQMVKQYFDKLNIVITRPFNYTGAGQSEDFVVPKIVSHFRQKRKIIELGNINVNREFNDVEFICEVYSRLLFSEAKSTVVNVCSGRGFPLSEIIDVMRDLSEHNIEISINPNFVRKNEIASLTGSTSKLESLIGEIVPSNIRVVLSKMYFGDI